MVYCPLGCQTDAGEKYREKLNIDIGPIWNHQDSARKVEAFLQTHKDLDEKYEWTGHWWTTIPGRMSAAEFQTKEQLTRYPHRTMQRSQIEAHMAECPLYLLRCPSCELEVPRKDLEQHDCLQLLRARHDEKKIQLDRLKRALGQGEFAPKCRAGHSMSLIEGDLSDQNVSCTCGEVNLQRHQSYFSCRECSESKCRACLLVLAGLVQVEDKFHPCKRNTLRKTISTQQWRCMQAEKNKCKHQELSAKTGKAFTTQRWADASKGLSLCLECLLHYGSLTDKPLTTCMGQLYLQNDRYGIASYQFDELDPLDPSKKGSYIIYSGIPASWRLSNGQPPPERVYFEDQSYCSVTRTFKGKIRWDPHNFHEDHRWEYSMVFSKDFTKIESGFCVRYGANEQVRGIDEFNRTLHYAIS